MTIPGKTDYLLKFHLSQDIIISTHGGIQTHNLWIRSPTHLSIARSRHMCSDMIGFSIYISCYNFPIVIAYFNCILKIYSSEDITSLPWRNWLARSAFNRKVWWFKPTREWFSFYSAHTFTHLSTRSLFRKLWLFDYHRQAKDKLLKNQCRTQDILPLWQSQGKQSTCWNSTFPRI